MAAEAVEEEAAEPGIVKSSDGGEGCCRRGTGSAMSVAMDASWTLSAAGTARVGDEEDGGDGITCAGGTPDEDAVVYTTDRLEGDSSASTSSSSSSSSSSGDSAAATDLSLADPWRCGGTGLTVAVDEDDDWRCRRAGRKDEEDDVSWEALCGW